ncbi:serine acetyltransferase [Pseudomonas chlororaphis]
MKASTLVDYWTAEVSNKKKRGSAIGLITNILRRTRKNNTLRYLFNFRLAQYLYSKNNMLRAYAKRMERKLNLKYGVDISIECKIERGLRIGHLPGIVISSHAAIGANCFIRQNTTIGIKTMGLDSYHIEIGDNVSIGAHTCIISDNLVIGDNVTIGAMSFVNKNISAGSTFLNPR